MRNTLYNLIISRLASFVKVFFVFFANIYDVFLHSCNAQTSFCPFVVIYAYNAGIIPQTEGDFVRRGADGSPRASTPTNELYFVRREANGWLTALSTTSWSPSPVSGRLRSLRSCDGERGFVRGGGCRREKFICVVGVDVLGDPCDQRDRRAVGVEKKACL